MRKETRRRVTRTRFKIARREMVQAMRVFEIRRHRREEEKSVKNKEEK